jgi:hypothetical protein
MCEHQSSVVSKVHVSKAAFIARHIDTRRASKNQHYLNKGCVSHCDLAIYIKKVSSSKRRIMETQIFRHAKILLIFKKLL